MLRFKLLIPFLILLGAISQTGAAESDWSGRFNADLRVRQEILDDVYHFASDSDRNWIRVRSRLGYTLAGAGHRFDVKLANEHRHIIHPDIHPDTDFDWDEVIVDQLNWTWEFLPGRKLTVGRQNIIWPGGFLMLEGHPLDGSRSIYHNAVRLRQGTHLGHLDLSLIRNPVRDDFVLIDDENRQLTHNEETGVAARWERGLWSSSLIWKREELEFQDEDLTTYTWSAGFSEPGEETTRLIGEIAVQRRDLDFEWNFRWDQDGDVFWDDWALAGHFSVTRSMGGDNIIESGAFYYSGDGLNMNTFLTPWGSWPKWSELYIYTLIGESEPGRVHVAAWENIAAGRIEWRRPLIRIADRPIDLRVAALFLTAPKPEWRGRGLLTQVELKAELAAGWKSHLLWERLEPGAFHDQATGPLFFDEPVHFVRWQLSYAIR